MTTLRPIPGYEGLYSVTADGQVWSETRITPHGHRWSGRWMWPQKDRKGYFWLKLSKDGEKQGWALHQLVLSTFAGPCPDGMEGCHINGDPSCNHIYNLRWDTPSGNRQDSKRHGTLFWPGLKGEKHGRAKLTDADIIDIRTRYHVGGEKQQTLADAYGVCNQLVSRIVCGGIWRHL